MELVSSECGTKRCEQYSQEYARKEFNLHGEDWILSHLMVHQANLKVILDVGSNIGEWTKMAREFHPKSEIHTFEIVYNTYKKLLSNVFATETDNKIIPNGFGLSDSCGTLRMKWRKDHDVVSTYLDKLAVENFEWRDCIVFTGDQYLSSRGIDYVDFLKIDVEGAEGKVLEGFRETLKQGKIGIIQFEYGLAAILSKFLLVDAYELLRPYGYILGRLHQGRIDFKEYHLLDEDFSTKGSSQDYVAVHHSKMFLFA